MSNEISAKDLRDYIMRSIPMTFDLVKKIDASERGPFDSYWWARGRIDALLQLLGPLDNQALEMFEAEWKIILGDENWTDEIPEFPGPDGGSAA